MDVYASESDQIDADNQHHEIGNHGKLMIMYALTSRQDTSNSIHYLCTLYSNKLI